MTSRKCHTPSPTTARAAQRPRRSAGPPPFNLSPEIDYATEPGTFYNRNILYLRNSSWGPLDDDPLEVFPRHQHPSSPQQPQRQPWRSWSPYIDSSQVHQALAYMSVSDTSPFPIDISEEQPIDEGANQTETRQQKHEGKEGGDATAAAAATSSFFSCLKWPFSRTKRRPQQQGLPQTQVGKSAPSSAAPPAEPVRPAHVFDPSRSQRRSRYHSEPSTSPLPPPSRRELADTMHSSLAKVRSRRSRCFGTAPGGDTAAAAGLPPRVRPQPILEEPELELNSELEPELEPAESEESASFDHWLTQRSMARRRGSIDDHVDYGILFPSRQGPPVLRNCVAAAQCKEGCD